MLRTGDWICGELPAPLVLRFVETPLASVGPRASALPLTEDPILKSPGPLLPNEPPDSDHVLTQDLERALQWSGARPCPAVFSFRGGQQSVVLATELELSS